MFRVVRAVTLRGLRVDAAAARGLRADAEGACAETGQWRERYLAGVSAAAAAEARIGELREELAKALQERGQAWVARERAMGDLVKVRGLASERAACPDGVYVLLRRGEPHSVHGTVASAMVAAEAEGASRDGWCRAPEGAASPGTETGWQIQGPFFGGVR